ncbi:MAG TPA: hypothetical protein ENN09_04105 [Planctomycetes bacterium]|nr:hypothetical protein [Planctomycetota bacterium]
MPRRTLHSSLQRQSPAPEAPEGFRRIHYLSAISPGMLLSALVSDNVEDPALPIIVFHHGWHQEAATVADYGRTIAGAGCVAILPDMRGRGKSQGVPDASGYELQDSVDALDCIEELYPRGEGVPGPYVAGASGGGGNTCSITAHFPYRFAAALSLCGMTDYAVWYEDDAEGVFRDEMDVWIGGPPSAFSTAYRNRSVLHLLANLRMPLYALHGEEDSAVSVEHARRLAARRDDEKFGGLVEPLMLPGVGHAIPAEHWLPVLSVLPERHPLGLLPGRNETYVVAGYIELGFLRVDLGTMNASARLELTQERDGVPRVRVLPLDGASPAVRVAVRMGAEAGHEVTAGVLALERRSGGVIDLFFNDWQNGIGLEIPKGILP